MFEENSIFNGNISSWDTHEVTQMKGMFSSAVKFNGNISSWDTHNVTDMSEMFLNAQSFNQNLGLWNVSKVTTMNNMFNAINLSVSNYDSILNGWSSQSVKNAVPLTAVGVTPRKYSCAGKVGRDILTGTYNWTITDGGLNESCITDSCTYSGSGNWLIQVTDNCTVTVDTNVTGNLTFNGDNGTFTFNATVTAVKTIFNLTDYDGDSRLIWNPGKKLKTG
jgi:surface protein